MGPSLESNGMPTARRLPPVPGVGRFNGAVARKQRNAELVSDVTGEPMELQWGRRSKATECGRSSKRPCWPLSFNGAVARKQRNDPRLWSCRDRASASMGPSLESNGMVLSTTEASRALDASMGPSLESNGMAALSRELSIRVEQLQWGRRSKATECYGPRGALRGVPSLASMGPSLESNGMTIPSPSRGIDTLLQWGRRSKATECLRLCGHYHATDLASMGPSLESNGMNFARLVRGHVRAASMGPSLESNGMTVNEREAKLALSLQWGRRSKATECRDQTLKLHANVAASMGPSLESNGMQKAALRVHLQRRSFNGAVARKQRNGTAPTNARAALSGLQWGRRSKATECYDCSN